VRETASYQCEAREFPLPGQKIAREPRLSAGRPDHQARERTASEKSMLGLALPQPSQCAKVSGFGMTKALKPPTLEVPVRAIFWKVDGVTIRDRP